MHDGDDRPLGDFETTLDSVELLKVALRDEHSLLTQYKMITWGRIFTPIQVRRRGWAGVIRSGLGFCVQITICF